MINKIKLIVLCCVLMFLFKETSYSYIDETDVKNNSIIHNINGLMYLDQKLYNFAISEFQLAIELNPNVQSTAVFYDNLGRVYLKIGNYKLAQNCFEMAIKQNSIYFNYYLHLVESFRLQNILNKKINYYKSKMKGNYQYTMLVGIMLIESGKYKEGEKILIDLIKEEPNYLMTEAIKKYLTGLIK